MGDGDGTATGKSQSRLRDHRPLALHPDLLREVMKLFPQAVVGCVVFGAACLLRPVMGSQGSFFNLVLR
jgi:hypothetical protein